MPARKRQAPSTPVASGRRRSQRIDSSGQKSIYFEPDTDEEEEDELTSSPAFKRVKPSDSSRRKPGSGGAGGRRKVESDEEDVYDDEDEDDGDEDDDGEDEDDYYDDASGDDVPQGRQSKSKQKGRSSRKEAVDATTETSDDDDDDGKPRVTFIPHKQMRDTGGIDYADDRLHKNTLLFLKDLKAHNDRTWLKDNDKEYRRSLKDWETFVETFTQKMIEADDTIPELPIKDVIFRIYRDVRFSKDPTPYKAHYSAAWSRTGRKGPYACYYIHCEPGACRIGGGLWHPDADQMHKLRASIDERPRRWRRALMDETFRQTFFPDAKGNEKSVLKAFTSRNKDGALKTKPKGFNPDHRDIELLKLRNFTVGKKFPDSLMTAADGQEKLAELVSAMTGFVTHLNNIVMPDNLDSDSESEGGE